MKGLRTFFWKRGTVGTAEVLLAAILAVSVAHAACFNRRFIRGDANGDARINVSDAVYVLTYLFRNGPQPPCIDAADAHDDGTIGIADPIRILGYLFIGDAPPAAPSDACGYDPTPDGLPCESYPPCAEAVAITGITPATGPAAGGTEITIAGRGFTCTADTEVLIGAKALVDLRVIDHTTIRGTTPPTDTPGPMTVTVSCSEGQASLPEGFVYLSPVTISVLVPASGPVTGGTRMVIRGDGFIASPDTCIRVGSAELLDVRVESTTRIVGLTPAADNPCLVSVTVSCPAGEATLADGFLYEDIVQTHEPGRFHRTAGMPRPRYEHTATSLLDGGVLVAGGSDESTFTSIDTAAIFHQHLVTGPTRASETGGWIDTDFEGEPIRLRGGGRIFHTATRLANGNVLIAGGTYSAVGGCRRGTPPDVHEHPEIFDATTRRFVQLNGAMQEPRVHHTAVREPGDEIIFFGGQIGLCVTIVDPNYPPNDPRFLRTINSYPSTRGIESFRRDLPSEDDLGDFERVMDGNGIPASLSGNQGRAIHATVRIAGLDNRLNDNQDLYVTAGGIRTLSPTFAPEHKLRRLSGDTTLVPGLDVYDAHTRSSFIAPGVYLEEPRAHGVIAENMGWRHNRTHDGCSGLSNVFAIFGGSDDTFPTTGAYLTEGFAATFTGLGPAGGISLLRTEPQPGDDSATIIKDILHEPADETVLKIIEEVAARTSRSLPAFADRRLGKFNGVEAIGNPQVPWHVPIPINRVHTQAARVVRQVSIGGETVEFGALFTAGGGFLMRAGRDQLEFYDEVPVAVGEYFYSDYNLINAAFDPQRNPFNLDAVRQYWSAKIGASMPEKDDLRDHPHPTGHEGAWLLADGNVPGDEFQGYQWLPPYSENLDNMSLHAMERGRAWHTLSILPGPDGKAGTVDDTILLAGGGQGVLSWGGEPVVPSAIMHIPAPAKAGAN